jgi:hypothetical protein
VQAVTNDTTIKPEKGWTLISLVPPQPLKERREKETGTKPDTAPSTV